MHRSSPILAAVLVLLSLGIGLAEDPENQRLPGKTFRRGLKQLGLTDLLDFYIREFPPKDPIQAGLLKRELRLNLYSDPTVPPAERLHALGDATTILRDLIRSHPDHEDHFEWQLDLGRDLIFRKAEPYRNNIMLRGGTDDDRKALSQITTEALSVYDRLVGELVQAELRIDRLSIKQFEKYAKSGYIQKIEELLPRARYFRLWASYYHCLTLGPGSSSLARQPLNEIIDYLNDESKLTSIEHGISHYQAQSLLLAGMAYRLLGSSDRAEEFLFKGSSAASDIPSFAERHNLKWVVTFAALERVKNFRDTGQYDLALRTLEDFRSQLPSSALDQFSLHFALALLEGTVYRVQANKLPAQASSRKAALLLKSRQALIDLAREHPQYQNEVYATLFELLGDVADPSSLDSFEKNIFLAGLLRKAGEINRELKIERAQANSTAAARLEKEKDKSLGQAAALASSLLEEDSVLALELRPEVRFNLAVCRFEQDRVLEAIKQFNLVAKDHLHFPKSRLAVEYAVRLSESLYARAEPSAQRSIRPYYLQALRGLLGFHRDSLLAEGRQYTYASVLREDGQYREAAAQYVRVQADDPKYLEALFHIAECNLILLRQVAGGDDRRPVSSQAAVTLDSVSRFQKKLSGAGPEGMNRYLAESRLISAEANMLRPTKLPDQALQDLAGFEAEFPAELDLIGRAMRIRILAYQELGDLEQAAAIIPDYIERDPQNAGATLQGLLDTFKEEIVGAERAGRLEEAGQKAEDALLVAKSLYEWAALPAAGLDRSAQLALKLEYGEALLRTDRSTEALGLFRTAVEEDAAGQPDGRSRNGRALYGLAQSYLQAQRPRDALAHFSRLYRDSPQDSNLWWRSFLGEIRCRMALDQNTQKLYNLISQKRVFYPRMGGPELKKQFQQLQAELSEKS